MIVVVNDEVMDIDCVSMMDNIAHCDRNHGTHWIDMMDMMDMMDDSTMEDIEVMVRDTEDRDMDNVVIETEDMEDMVEHRGGD